MAEKYIPFLEKNVTLHTDKVFNGNLLQVYKNKIQLPQGAVVDREFIHHQSAVCILAQTYDQQVILVRQYRPAVGEYLYELPAGLIDSINGQLEEPLHAAQRELNEETGYESEDWQEGPRTYLSPGYLDEAIHFWIAKKCQRASVKFNQDPDEDVTHHAFSRDQIQTMIQTKQIKDLKTLFALTFWLNE